MLWGEDIALCPREYYGYSRQIHCEHSLIFDIVQRSDARIVGEIALRVGDSAEQFYLGHIGYHIDPPFRGHAYAAQACKACEPLLAAFGQRSIVITTDPDNAPSVKTCQRLNCELECTVKVPPQVMNKLEISPEKRRYIWMLDQNSVEKLKKM